MFSIAASVGSTESLVMPPQLLHGGDYTAEQRAQSLVGKGTVRLSIGLEDEGDLKADLAKVCNWHSANAMIYITLQLRIKISPNSLHLTSVAPGMSRAKS